MSPESFLFIPLQPPFPICRTPFCPYIKKILFQSILLIISDPHFISMSPESFIHSSPTPFSPYAAPHSAHISNIELTSPAARDDSLVAREPRDDLHRDAHHGEGRPPPADHDHVDRHVQRILRHLCRGHTRRGLRRRARADGQPTGARFHADRSFGDPQLWRPPLLETPTFGECKI